jgi:uncharacterized membrane protein YbhN (UPF0104 family)
MSTATYSPPRRRPATTATVDRPRSERISPELVHDAPGPVPPGPVPPGPLPLARWLLGLVLPAGLGIALALAVPGLGGVVHEARQLSAGWLAIAVGLELASGISFVVLFRRFFDRLPGRDARDLAWAEQATGALLPGGGAGGIAIGAWLMRESGVATEWIMRRSGGIFFLTTAVNAFSLVAAGVALMAGVSGTDGLLLVTLPTVVVVVLVIAVVACSHALRRRQTAPAWARVAAAGIEDAERAAFQEPHWRLLGAAGYLGFDMAVLWVTLRAIGPGPSVPDLVLAYNIGYLANLLPVPAGIGVLDVGLTGALVLYGVAPTQAAAAVVIYHAIAFWVPGLGGSFAYLRLRRRLFAKAGRSRPVSRPQVQEQGALS